MKLLIATIGTLGDVRPFVALASAAQARGHDVRLAATMRHASLASRHGVCFESFGDDAYLEAPECRSAMTDPLSGFSYWLAKSNLEQLPRLHERLETLAAGIDVLVSTPFVSSATIAAETLGIPLVNCALSPASLLPFHAGGSRVDPHALAWRRTLNSLRERAGLQRRAFPQMDRLRADLTLGLYPALLDDAGANYITAPQSIGYPLLDDRGEPQLAPDLKRWMDAAPFAFFSFGSFVDRGASACLAAASFACERLGLRCLYTFPHSQRERPQAPEGVRIETYVPHLEAMARAAVVVHHGGTGSLAAAIKSGRPTVIVPFALDQPFNARRMTELDLAEVLPIEALSPDALFLAIQRARMAGARRAPLSEAAGATIGAGYAGLAIEAIEEFVRSRRSSTAADVAQTDA